MICCTALVPTRQLSSTYSVSVRLPIAIFFSIEPTPFYRVGTSR